LEKFAPPLLSGYATVNGLKMYYERSGKGPELVLLHGGGSTIQTSFGRIIPQLSQQHSVLAVELQAHGRTADRNQELSFKQDADDVAALLDHLGTASADVLGFSNGATTALYLAARHPAKIRKVIAASPLCKRHHAPEQFWEFMRTGTIDQMPQQYKDAYRSVGRNAEELFQLFNRCANRMISFTDMSDEELQAIKAPVLLVNGNQDVMTSEHAVALQKMIADCQLAILPGGHGAYLGEITSLQENKKPWLYFLPLVEEFLNP
jgi:pimeloyl-ACP methyl ester carboxylesterase